MKESKDMLKVNRKLIGVIGIIVFIFLVIGAIVLINGDTLGNVITNITNPKHCEVVQVPYQGTEYYTESEPYTTQDCQNVNMIYKINYGTGSSSCLQNECATYDQVCAEWNWLHTSCNRYVDGSCSSYKCTKYNQHCVLTINNQERSTLSLQIELDKWSFDTKSSTTIQGENFYNVAPLDSRTLTWDYSYLPTEATNCYYQVLNTPQMPSCKDVILYHDVQKSRTVTLYKNETQCN